MRGREDVAGVALHPHQLPHLVDELDRGDVAVQGGARVPTGGQAGGGGVGPDAQVGAGGERLPHHHVALLTPPLDRGPHVVLLPRSHRQAAVRGSSGSRTEDGLAVRDEAGPDTSLSTGERSPPCQPVTKGTVEDGLAEVRVVEMEKSEVRGDNLQRRTLHGLAPRVSP